MFLAEIRFYDVKLINIGRQRHGELTERENLKVWHGFLSYHGIHILYHIHGGSHHHHHHHQKSAVRLEETHCIATSHITVFAFNVREQYSNQIKWISLKSYAIICNIE